MKYHSVCIDRKKILKFTDKIKLKKLSKLRKDRESPSLLKLGWNHKSLVDIYYLKKLGVSFDFLD